MENTLKKKYVNIKNIDSKYTDALEKGYSYPPNGSINDLVGATVYTLLSNKYFKMLNQKFGCIKVDSASKASVILASGLFQDRIANYSYPMFIDVENRFETFKMVNVRLVYSTTKSYRVNDTNYSYKVSLLDDTEKFLEYNKKSVFNQIFFPNTEVAYTLDALFGDVFRHIFYKEPYMNAKYSEQFKQSFQNIENILNPEEADYIINNIYIQLLSYELLVNTPYKKLIPFDKEIQSIIDPDLSSIYETAENLIQSGFSKEETCKILNITPSNIPLFEEVPALEKLLGIKFNYSKYF